MAYPFTVDSIIGEIVNDLPKSSDLFKKNRIDFCCGGNRPIKEAASERGLDAEVLVSTLNGLYEEMNTEGVQQDWMTADLSSIVDYVVNTHHRYLNEEFPQLTPYVTKVLRVHGVDSPHLKEVHSLFHTIKTELEQHIIKEETELFPYVKIYENDPSSENLNKLLAQLDGLESEHDAVGQALKQLRDVTNDFVPPMGACRTYQLVYNRLEALEDDTFRHVHLENNILFKRIKELG
ncbi:regulator of cell morphogenesis and NO signaling [Oikeobacillus pervagus]|uniref:Regulator of cell morphogenesis and NO signaling n=1 Tax=Oikeobacillus pervagus TaxID=1325931 RepID=A0AAJ1T0L5_9BACI|nr:iron-sulfur cluster repair di-iron protein [Oikeobacillus pervagus]MDQ0216439.1 regulator of cell morphogenesis and NO signaling [Oikeobacillus pervagus]